MWRKNQKDIEQGVLAFVFVIAMLIYPFFVAGMNYEIRDSAIFLYNHTQNGTEDFVVIHTSPFSMSPYKIYFPQAEHYLYSNLTKEMLFTAGGSLVEDYERIDNIEYMGKTTYFVSERRAGHVLWSEGGLNICEMGKN